MTDMLIRDVPDDVVAAMDAQPAGWGSRAASTFAAASPRTRLSGSPVSTGDLARFAEIFGDLDDPDVMSGAWE